MDNRKNAHEASKEKYKIFLIFLNLFSLLKLNLG